jgi:hypothetical protein
MEILNQCNRMLKFNITSLNIYRILSRPVLIYGSEAWTIIKADEKRLQAAEMKINIIGPIGRNILKEWILAESQTTS